MEGVISYRTVAVVMRELILLRHADAEPKPTRDFERRLTAKGHKDARRAGELLVKRGWIPDVVLTSPAPRARETCDDVCTAAGIRKEIVQDIGEIYDAEPITLLSLLSKARGKRVMLVGHNPGLSQLAVHLIEDPDLDVQGLSKAGIAWCELPDDWTDLAAGAAVKSELVGR